MITLLAVALKAYPGDFIFQIALTAKECLSFWTNPYVFGPENALFLLCTQ